MSEYAKKVQDAITAGNKAGLELKKRREAAGRNAASGGQYGTMPAILHNQLVERFGGNYAQDETLMKDLRRLHPEMMAADGDVPGDSPNGVHTVRGKVSYTRRGGVWYYWTGTEWVQKAPPSKMDWAKPAAPMIMK